MWDRKHVRIIEPADMAWLMFWTASSAKMTLKLETTIKHVPTPN